MPVTCSSLSVLLMCLAAPACAEGLHPVVPEGRPAALDARGELQAPCEMTDDKDNCVRVLACIGDEGRWFAGRASGRGKGELEGADSNGLRCRGEWTSRNWFGAGQARVECSDGSAGTVIYTYQDEYTGTATGSGRMSTGQTIQSWSGNHVPEFLTRETGRPALPCGSAPVPIS